MNHEIVESPVPIFAWKAWQLIWLTKEQCWRIESPYQKFEAEPWYEAQCQFEGSHEMPHGPPYETCKCGIWAFLTLEDCMARVNLHSYVYRRVIFSKVELYGRVLEHTDDAVRGQWCNIVSFHEFPICSWRNNTYMNSPTNNVWAHAAMAILSRQTMCLAPAHLRDHEIPHRCALKNPDYVARQRDGDMHALPATYKGIPVIIEQYPTDAIITVLAGEVELWAKANSVTRNWANLVWPSSANSGFKLPPNPKIEKKEYGPDEPNG